MMFTYVVYSFQECPHKMLSIQNILSSNLKAFIHRVATIHKIPKADPLDDVATDEAGDDLADEQRAC